MKEETNEAKRTGNKMNEKGLGFPSAVINQIKKIYGLTHDWRVEIEEFPVEINGKSTKIDIILNSIISIQENTPFYLLCECKRVNPKFKKWIFAKSLFQSEYPLSPTEIYRETLNKKDKNSILERYSIQEDVHHYFFEEKKEEENGYSHGQGKGALNEAITQLIKGLNGIINMIFNKRINNYMGFFRTAEKISFMPIIITTAELFSIKSILGKTNLATGNYEENDLELEKVDFIFLSYSQSYELQHDYLVKFEWNEPSQYSKYHNIRTIPIINSNGIDRFFSIEPIRSDHNWGIVK